MNALNEVGYRPGGQPDTLASSHSGINGTIALWLAVGLAGFCLLPWYVLEDGFWSFEWLDGYPFDSDYAPALFLLIQNQKLWLAPLLPCLLLPLLVLGKDKNHHWFNRLLIAAGICGLGYLLLQGFGIGIRGWNFEWASNLFGELGDRQFGLGYGAMFTAVSLLFFLTTGIAARGAINGDVFVVGAIGFVIALSLIHI